MNICTIAMSGLFNIAPEDAFQITKENLIKANLDPWDYLEATTDNNDNVALCFRMPMELAFKLDYAENQKRSLEGFYLQCFAHQERSLFRPTPNPFWDGQEQQQT